MTTIYCTTNTPLQSSTDWIQDERNQMWIGKSLWRLLCIPIRSFPTRFLQPLAQVCVVEQKAPLLRPPEYDAFSVSAWLVVYLDCTANLPVSSTVFNSCIWALCSPLSCLIRSSPCLWMLFCQAIPFYSTPRHLLAASSLKVSINSCSCLLWKRSSLSQMES